MYHVPNRSPPGTRPKRKDGGMQQGLPTCSPLWTRPATPPMCWTVHNPKVECGRPVLHAALPYVGPAWALRRWVSVEFPVDQWRTGAQTPPANRESVQERGVFHPADVGRHVNGHHGHVAPFHDHDALSPLDRVGGASRDPGPEYGDRTDQTLSVPWMLYGSTTAARPIRRSTRLCNIKSWARWERLRFC